MKEPLYRIEAIAPWTDGKWEPYDNSHVNLLVVGKKVFSNLKLDEKHGNEDKFQYRIVLV